MEERSQPRQARHEIESLSAGTLQHLHRLVIGAAMILAVICVLIEQSWPVMLPLIAITTALLVLGAALLVIHGNAHSTASLVISGNTALLEALGSLWLASRSNGANMALTRF